MLNKLKKVKFRDFFGFIIFVFALPFSILLKIKNRNKPIWLICELKNTARDNGYHFFKYMRINHPEYNCWYAIDMSSSDYDKIKDYGNIIQFGSFKHWVYYLSAEYNFSSHKEGNPNHLVFTFLHLYLKCFNNRVFLQHGITKDNAPMFYYKNTYFKYFICGALPEYNYILDNFGYPNKNIIYTGFPRFDSLHNLNVDSKLILLIPTWRRCFELLNSDEEFMNSAYYKTWNSFINNEKLLDYLNNNGIKMIFYPHFQISRFSHLFSSPSKYVEIANNNYDIQSLLKSSSLMITDYSSVYMDFAYMKKPVIYYHFDYDDYRKNHFSEGYFDYYKNGFGPIVKEEDELVNNIINYCDNNYEISACYLMRMTNFFELNDANNCSRIFNIVKKKD